MFFLKLFLWICGKRFDNPSEKLEKKGQKGFAQGPKRIKSTYVLQKFVFPQTVLMDKENAVITTPPKVCRKRPEISCSKSQIDTKIEKVHFPVYCPYGQVENSLDNIAKNIPMKGEPVRLNVRKLFEIFNSVERKMFSANCSYGDVEWSFDGAAENFPTKGPKIFAQGPKNLRKHRFLEKKVFGNCSFSHVEYSVGIPSKIFSKKCQKRFCSMCENNRKNLNFSEHCFFLKLFLGRCKMQF